MGGLVEVLVMVDAKYRRSSGCGWRCSYAADLWSEESRGHARHNHIRRKAVVIRNCGANGVTGNFRTGPFDRIGNWSVAEHAEVERFMRILPDVLAIDDQIFSEGLLHFAPQFGGSSEERGGKTVRGDAAHAGPEDRRGNASVLSHK
jgi:hypothetical protein